MRKELLLVLLVSLIAIVGCSNNDTAEEPEDPALEKMKIADPPSEELYALVTKKGEPITDTSTKNCVFSLADIESFGSDLFSGTLKLWHSKIESYMTMAYGDDSYYIHFYSHGRFLFKAVLYNILSSSLPNGLAFVCYIEKDGLMHYGFSTIRTTGKQYETDAEHEQRLNGMRQLAEILNKAGKYSPVESVNTTIVSGDLHYTILPDKDHEVEVAPSRSYKGVIRVPETITHEGITYRVTSIGKKAFDDCIAVTSVSLPTTLKAIQSQAFYNTRITSINIPEQVEIIGSAAFACCTKLETVVIPDAVTNLGQSAFCGCHSLKKVVLPAHISTLEMNMFLWDRELSEVTLPDSLVKIDQSVFSGCPLDTVILPATLKELGSFAYGYYSYGYESEEDVPTPIKAVMCYLKEPTISPYKVFDGRLSAETVLYVPKGSKELFSADTSWGSLFKNIEEMP